MLCRAPVSQTLRRPPDFEMYAMKSFPSSAAAEEALKAVIGPAVAKGVDPLISPFIKALSSALVKTSLAQLSASDIVDYNAAVAFVKKNRLNWSWRFPPANRNSESGGGGGSSMFGSDFAEVGFTRFQPAERPDRRLRGSSPVLCALPSQHYRNRT